MSKQIEKAIIMSLPKYEAGYINIARMRNGNWSVCWYAKWFGSTRRNEAVVLRKEWLEFLQKATGGKKKSCWKENMLKTIRVV